MAPAVFPTINTIMIYNEIKLVQSTHFEKLLLLLATNTLCSTHDLQEAGNENRCLLVFILPLDGVHVCHE